MVEISTPMVNHLHLHSLCEKSSVIKYLLGIDPLHRHYFFKFTQLGQRNVRSLNAQGIFNCSISWSFLLSTSIWRGSLVLGRCETYITHWFPNFDPNTMPFTWMPIWVHLTNLSLYLWNISFFEYIGNALDTYIKYNFERTITSLCTHLCWDWPY